MASGGSLKVFKGGRFEFKQLRRPRAVRELGSAVSGGR